MINNQCVIVLSLVAVVGLERSLYEVRLDEGVVEVCGNISTPNECPIEFPFEIRLLSSETTAGMYKYKNEVGCRDDTVPKL